MDPMTIIMLAVLALLIFFMFRNGQKRKADMAKLQDQVVAGAEVMTNSGIFGTILSIDEENNKVLLETSPGTVLTVHRQIINRVVEDTEAVEETTEEAEAPRLQLNEDNAEFVGEPEFGERVKPAEQSKPKTED